MMKDSGTPRAASLSAKIVGESRGEIDKKGPSKRFWFIWMGSDTVVERDASIFSAALCLVCKLMLIE